MAKYTVQFPFLRHGQPLAAGDVIEVSASQAAFWLSDGRIAPLADAADIGETDSGGGEAQAEASS